MLGSIFTGLSGMNAFSNALRRISNNITNINSNGFKASTVTFSGLFGAARGGQPYGVSLDKPTINFAQGELRQSDQDLDLGIDGAGFLVLEKDGRWFFTRTGSFTVNADGDVVLGHTQYKLAVLNDAGRPTPVSINPCRTHPPQQTTTVKFADNLSSTATTYDLSDIKVFDAQGASDTWHARFERGVNAAPGEWSLIVTASNGSEIGRQTLKFVNGVIDPATAKLAFTDSASARSATFDFSQNVTSFSSGSVSTLRVADVDGFGSGDITGLAVNEDGELQISYSNEQKKSLGAVALANFRDPQALEQRDGSLFEQAKAADPDFLASASERVGRVMSKRLEASNVDLSQEFGDLILVQRGFQASSQIISVSNDMIQQLFGIRGQS